jgi:predicted nucleic acid-binding Zn ribbon protein
MKRHYGENQCIICNTKFKASRYDAKYCSTKCRSKAYYERRKVEQKYKNNVLTMFEMQDVRTIAKYAPEGAATVVKVATVAGAELAREVLDGYWAVLVACGQLNEPKS